MKPCDNRSSPSVVAGGLCFLLACTALLAGSRPVFAHDPPVIDFSRRVQVRIDPSGVRVHYRLEISTFTLYRLPQLDPKIDIAQIDKAHPGKSLAEAYLQRLKRLIPDQIE